MPTTVQAPGKPKGPLEGRVALGADSEPGFIPESVEYDPTRARTHDESKREEIKASLGAEYKDAEHYDKWLLTLSSGAFGISIAFMRYIAPDPTPVSKGFLVAAWGSLLLTILATMSSMQFSQSGFRQYRKTLTQDNKTNKPAYWAKVLNWVSLALFIVGAAMLAVFSFLNLGGHTHAT